LYSRNIAHPVLLANAKSRKEYFKRPFLPLGLHLRVRTFLIMAHFDLYGFGVNQDLCK
jgi:hypothetical protein